MSWSERRQRQQGIPCKETITEKKKAARAWPPPKQHGRCRRGSGRRTGARKQHGSARAWSPPKQRGAWSWSPHRCAEAARSRHRSSEDAAGAEWGGRRRPRHDGGGGREERENGAEHKKAHLSQNGYAKIPTLKFVYKSCVTLKFFRLSSWSIFRYFDSTRPSKSDSTPPKTP